MQGSQCVTCFPLAPHSSHLPQGFLRTATVLTRNRVASEQRHSAEQMVSAKLYGCEWRTQFVTFFKVIERIIFPTLPEHIFLSCCQDPSQKLQLPNLLSSNFRKRTKIPTICYEIGTNIIILWGFYMEFLRASRWLTFNAGSHLRPETDKKYLQ